VRLLGIDESGDWRWHVKPLMTGMARSSSAFEAQASRSVAALRARARADENFAGDSSRKRSAHRTKDSTVPVKRPRGSRYTAHFKLYFASDMHVVENHNNTSYEAPAAAIDLTARTG